MRSPRGGRKMSWDICAVTPHSSRTSAFSAGSWRVARNSSRRLRLGLCAPPGGMHQLFRVPDPFAQCSASCGSRLNPYSAAAQLLTQFSQGPVRLLFQLDAYLIFDGLRHPPMRRATSC